MRDSSQRAITPRFAFVFVMAPGYSTRRPIRNVRPVGQPMAFQPFVNGENLRHFAASRHEIDLRRISNMERDPGRRRHRKKKKERRRGEDEEEEEEGNSRLVVHLSPCLPPWPLRTVQLPCCVCPPPSPLPPSPFPLLHSLPVIW